MLALYGLSTQFKKIRVEKNLTQKQVADGIGVAEQAYQRYEYGKTVPSALVLIALADYFDVSLDYLVGRSDDPARH
ncbi:MULTISPECIES: helix-turn-helix domain-containing protein [Anaerotruncus]|uniref:helix-turn-helix domain-containing protein n=1 Tax=Anaerotruncus TaxID=244127 RepID=UPI001FA94349|nr:helix-turn-helix transcriptional regulator [Anaerotruncus massiliensis (ex Liu et al. 2021)]